MSTTEVIEKKLTTEVVSPLPESECKSCENCHLPLNGPFCANCGQEATSTLKYFWVVILHILDDFFSFDSRANRTLWPLITRPAFLTKEYFAGRRVRYVPPLRLYLFISIVFFLTLKFFANSDGNNFVNINDNQKVITQLKEHVETLKIKQASLSEQKSADTEPLAEVTEELTRFTTYLTDLELNYEGAKNKRIVKTTRKIVNLELEKLTTKVPLSTKDSERFDKLMTKLADIKASETIEGDDKESISVGNHPDGTLSFGFLSDEDNKKLDKFADGLVEKFDKSMNSGSDQLIEQAIGKLPQLMFILLPLFALLLKVMFCFSNRLYMEHLTVALHSHSFIFFSLLLAELFGELDKLIEKNFVDIASLFDWLNTGVIIWIPIYLFIMQKRVYKQGYFFTAVKYFIISTVYSIMIAFTAFVALVWGLTDI
ncbi:MAG: DUF3667 domain-containing protein [Colwellia sp.]|nr:DUF3667 domain-containing protein [Colwellia sp.]